MLIATRFGKFDAHPGQLKQEHRLNIEFPISELDKLKRVFGGHLAVRVGIDSNHTVYVYPDQRQGKALSVKVGRTLQLVRTCSERPEIEYMRGCGLTQPYMCEFAGGRLTIPYPGPDLWIAQRQVVRGGEQPLARTAKLLAANEQLTAYQRPKQERSNELLCCDEQGNVVRHYDKLTAEQLGRAVVFLDGLTKKRA